MGITLSDRIKISGLPTSDEWQIVIHPAEEGGFWGEIPALRGCASYGATRAECRAAVREAAQGCLEVYFEEALRKITRTRPTKRDKAMALA